MRLFFHRNNKKIFMIHEQLWPIAKKLKETKKNIEIEVYRQQKTPLYKETTKKDTS
jgi:hypothetical protein